MLQSLKDQLSSLVLLAQQNDLNFAAEFIQSQIEQDAAKNKQYPTSSAHKDQQITRYFQGVADIIEKVSQFPIPEQNQIKLATLRDECLVMAQTIPPEAVFLSAWLPALPTPTLCEATLGNLYSAHQVQQYALKTIGKSGMNAIILDEAMRTLLTRCASWLKIAGNWEIDEQLKSEFATMHLQTKTLLGHG